MEKSTKMDDLGVPPFVEPPHFLSTSFRITKHAVKLRSPTASFETAFLPQHLNMSSVSKETIQYVTLTFYAVTFYSMTFILFQDIPFWLVLSTSLKKTNSKLG